MKQQKFITTTAAILMVCLLISGYYAVAAEYGSADDPLITQSYLDAVVTPKAVAAAEDAAGAQADTLSARISALSDQLDARITQAAAAARMVNTGSGRRRFSAEITFLFASAVMPAMMSSCSVAGPGSSSACHDSRMKRRSSR